MALKILTQEKKITQTNNANSEHKHSEFAHFSVLNERVITCSLSPVIVNCQ